MTQFIEILDNIYNANQLIELNMNISKFTSLDSIKP